MEIEDLYIHLKKKPELGSSNKNFFSENCAKKKKIALRWWDAELNKYEPKIKNKIAVYFPGRRARLAENQSERAAESRRVWEQDIVPGSSINDK